MHNTLDKDKEREKADAEKGRALDSAMSQITKSYGKGAIMKLESTSRSAAR